MALLSFVDQAPRAYWLKVGNACSLLFNIDRDIPEDLGNYMAITKIQRSQETARL